jgi:hypothetical protein
MVMMMMIREGVMLVMIIHLVVCHLRRLRGLEALVEVEEVVVQVAAQDMALIILPVAVQVMGVMMGVMMVLVMVVIVVVVVAEMRKMMVMIVRRRMMVRVSHSLAVVGWRALIRTPSRLRMRC